MVRTVGIVAVMLLMLPAVRPLDAQAVRGIVVEQGTGNPIAGAMVLVLDTLGRVAARGFTDTEGAFRATVSAVGQYRARVERIGYESLTTERFDAPPDGTFRRIVVPIRPVELGGLDVTGARRCEVRPEVGRATAVVWGEARKALEAAAWTAESSQYRYTLLHFARRIDAEGEVTLGEDRQFFSLTGQAPYVSAPPGELASHGYVRELPSGNLSYFAPDAEVLLSDAFLDSHCMRLEARTDSLVGLAFEPMRGGEVADVQGTLWLHEASAELRYMEFRYVDVGRGRAVGEAGGALSFARLQGGGWIVRKWHVRMPVLKRTSPVLYQRTGYEDKGGVVWRVADHRGAPLYKAVTATVLGRAVDSVGAALPGVALVAAGLPGRAVTDSAGAYGLLDLPEGRVEVDVVAPYLDTLGLKAGGFPRSMDLSEGDTARLDFRIPGVGEAASVACGGGKRPDGTGILLGRVIASHLPPAGARVLLSLPSGPAHIKLNPRAAPPGGTGVPSRWEWVGGRAFSLETTLDEQGVFILCDIPLPSVLRAYAEVGQEAGEIDVTLAVGAPVTTVTVLTRPARN